MEYSATNGKIYTIESRENDQYWIENYNAPKQFFTYSVSDATPECPNRRLVKQTNQLSMCLITSAEMMIAEIELEISKSKIVVSTEPTKPTKTAVNYTVTGQAIELLNSKTPEEFEKWNQRQIEHADKQRELDAFDEA